MHLALNYHIGAALQLILMVHTFGTILIGQRITLISFSLFVPHIKLFFQVKLLLGHHHQVVLGLRLDQLPKFSYWFKSKLLRFQHCSFPTIDSSELWFPYGLKMKQIIYTVIFKALKLICLWPSSHFLAARGSSLPAWPWENRHLLHRSFVTIHKFSWKVWQNYCFQYVKEDMLKTLMKHK